jgi:hypothetical protein
MYPGIKGMAAAEMKKLEPEAEKKSSEPDFRPSRRKFRAISLFSPVYFSKWE